MGTYCYKPLEGSEHYLKVFHDHDDDMDYRHNQNGKTMYSMDEIVSMGEEHLIATNIESKT